jgi:hypothetical protein
MENEGAQQRLAAVFTSDGLVGVGEKMSTVRSIFVTRP